MKYLKIIFFFFLFFSTSFFSQTYDWKKINDGLYIHKISESSNSKKISKNDSLLVTLFIFHCNEEINLESHKNKTLLRDKRMSFENFIGLFNKNKIKLKKNSEYLLKSFNEKKIQQYRIEFKTNPKNDLKKLREYISDKYGIDKEETQFGLNKNKESIVFSSTIQPYKEIDTEDLKNKFGNMISKIIIGKPFLINNIYKIKTD